MLLRRGQLFRRMLDLRWQCTEQVFRNMGSMTRLDKMRHALAKINTTEGRVTLRLLSYCACRMLLNAVRC
jgi:hypothetical protein